MDDLKPCPFCGETPDVLNEATFQSDQGTKWGFVVCCCNGPEVRTGYAPVKEWKQDAIEAWNTRADAARIATLEAENARLRDIAVGMHEVALCFCVVVDEAVSKAFMPQITEAGEALGDTHD